MSEDSDMDDLENAIKLNQQRRFFRRKPRRVRDLLNHIITSRGLVATESSSQLQRIWDEVAGVDLANQTVVGPLRRGTLEVVVANSSMMQVLSFKKQELLKKIKTRTTDVKKIRFRVGKI